MHYLKNFIFSFLFFLSFASMCAQDISDIESSLIAESSDVVEPSQNIEMPDELNTVFAMMLEKLIPDLSDEAEIQFIQSIVEDHSLLGKSESADRAQEIFGRVETLKQLQSYEQLAKSDEDKEFIAEIMQDLSLLEKEDIQERFKGIVTKIKAENGGGKNFIKSVDKNFDRLKLGLISFFTLYRKMMFVRDLDNGHMPGSYQTWINRFAMIAFIGGNIVQQLIKGIMENAQDELSNTGFGAQNITSNDLYDNMSRSHAESFEKKFKEFIEKKFPNDDDEKIKKKKKSFFNPFRFFDNEVLSDAEKEINKKKKQFFRYSWKSYPLWFFNVFGVLDDKVLSKAEKEAKKIHKETKQLLSKEVQQHGCPGEILDFYNQFDSYLNNEIEKRADFILEKVKIPHTIRIMMLQNGVSRFTQKAFLFKILPTYFHWVGKSFVYDVFGFGFERFFYNKTSFDIYVKDYFKSSIPFKEAVKSVGELGRATFVGGAVRAINGKMTTTNKGRFYTAKEYTAGLVGPNTLKFLSELAMPPAMVKSSDLVRGKENFLKYEDFSGQKKLIKNGVGNYLAERTVSYITQTVISFALLKLVKTKNNGMISLAGKKAIKPFLFYLVKKNVIEQENVDIFLTQGVLFLPLFVPIVELVYMLVSGNVALLTPFDSQEAAFESQQMGDPYRELDYYIANIVGKFIGASVGFSYANFVFPTTNRT